MIKSLTLTFNEKKLFLIVGVLVLGVFIDLGARMWGGANLTLEQQRRTLEQQWAYAAAILGRADDIEARYQDASTRYPKLLESSQDTVNVMGELDEAAKASGIQMTMMRPLQGDDKKLDYDLVFRGSWMQVMDFLNRAESEGRVFDFPILRIHQVELTHDLEVTAVAVREVL